MGRKHDNETALHQGANDTTVVVINCCDITWRAPRARQGGLGRASLSKATGFKRQARLDGGEGVVPGPVFGGVRQNCLQHYYPMSDMLPLLSACYNNKTRPYSILGKS